MRGSVRRPSNKARRSLKWDVSRGACEKDCEGEIGAKSGNSQAQEVIRLSNHFLDN